MAAGMQEARKEENKIKMKKIMKTENHTHKETRAC
jgi:hypothetical protein